MLITNKSIQTHFQCSCGYNLVDHDSIPIRWKDLTRYGINRKKDKATGQYFLLKVTVAAECHGHDNYDY